MKSFKTWLVSMLWWSYMFDPKSGSQQQDTFFNLIVIILKVLYSFMVQAFHWMHTYMTQYPVTNWRWGLLKSAIEDNSPKVSSVSMSFQKVVFYFIPLMCFKAQGDMDILSPTCGTLRRHSSTNWEHSSRGRECDSTRQALRSYLIKKVFMMQKSSV